MIYGIPELSIDHDDTDLVGLRTLALSMEWDLPRWPMEIPEVDGLKPKIPNVPGGLLLVGERTARTPAGLITAWIFTGINGDGKEVTFKGRGNSLDYRFDPGYAQRDIALFPTIQKLLSKYDGQVVDGQIYWPPTYTNAAGKAVGSPMFGRLEFQDFDGTYSYRYVATSKAGLQNGVGQLFQGGGLPGEADVFADRDYKKLPVLWQRRGPVFEVLEQYQLSFPGGWPAPLNAIAADGGDTNHDTLTVNSLQAASGL